MKHTSVAAIGDIGGEADTNMADSDWVLTRIEHGLQAFEKAREN